MRKLVDAIKASNVGPGQELASKAKETSKGFQEGSKENNLPPLYHAMNLEAELRDYLIKNGADLDAKDHAGRTPLQLLLAGYQTAIPQERFPNREVFRQSVEILLSKYPQGTLSEEDLIECRKLAQALLEAAKKNCAQFPDVALEYLDGAIFLLNIIPAKSEGDWKCLGSTHSYLGNIYFKKLNYDLAINAFEKVIKLTDNLQQKSGFIWKQLAITQKNLGTAYLHIGEPEQAIRAFELSIGLGRNLSVNERNIFIKEGFNQIVTAINSLATSLLDDPPRVGFETVINYTFRFLSFYFENLAYLNGEGPSILKNLKLDFIISSCESRLKDKYEFYLCTKTCMNILTLIWNIFVEAPLLYAASPDIHLLLDQNPRFAHPLVFRGLNLLCEALDIALAKDYQRLCSSFTAELKKPGIYEALCKKLACFKIKREDTFSLQNKTIDLIRMQVEEKDQIIAALRKENEELRAESKREREPIDEKGEEKKSRIEGENHNRFFTKPALSDSTDSSTPPSPQGKN